MYRRANRDVHDSRVGRTSTSAPDLQVRLPSALPASTRSGVAGIHNLRKWSKVIVDCGGIAADVVDGFLAVVRARRRWSFDCGRSDRFRKTEMIRSVAEERPATEEIGAEKGAVAF